MNYLFVIFLIAVFPPFVGWLYGRNDTIPPAHLR